LNTIFNSKGRLEGNKLAGLVHGLRLASNLGITFLLQLRWRLSHDGGNGVVLKIIESSFFTSSPRDINLSLTMIIESVRSCMFIQVYFDLEELINPPFSLKFLIFLFWIICCFEFFSFFLKFYVVLRYNETLMLLFLLYH